MTFDSWRESKKNSVLNEAYRDQMSRNETSENARRVAEDSWAFYITNVSACHDRVETANSWVEYYRNQLLEISKNRNNYSSEQIAEYQRLWNEANQTKSISDMELKNAIDSVPIIRSDLSDVFYQLIDNYKEFLTTINSEQKIIIINIIGFLMLFITLINIISVLFGDYLIDKFKLESKYPKLAKFIQLRKKINESYLKFNIILLFIFIIFAIIINLYMFYIIMIS